MARCFVLFFEGKESIEACFGQKFEGYMVELAEKQAQTDPTRRLRKKSPRKCKLKGWAYNEEEGIKGRENTTHPPIFGVGGHEKRSLEAALHFMITPAEISAQWAYFSGFLGRVGPKKSKWGPIFTSQKSTQNVVSL